MSQARTAARRRVAPRTAEAGAAAEQVEERFGHLDVLINNAGITGSGQVAAQRRPRSGPQLCGPGHGPGGVRDQRLRGDRRDQRHVAAAAAVTGTAHRQRLQWRRLADHRQRPGRPLGGAAHPAQGAAILARLATLGAEGPTGGFLSEDGSVPW